MNALRVETCMLYMYFKETSLISHASLESSNKESINQSINQSIFNPYIYDSGPCLSGGKLDQYNRCWCPGTLCHQDINSDAIFM